MINQTTFSTLERAMADSQELLTTYAFGDELPGDFTTAFGSEYNRDAADNLVTQWQTGEFDSFPEVEIRNSAEINGANGAYSIDTNKIYIAEEYLLANTNNINAVSDLVLEEYGHYVDARINSVDAAGDEGDIFSGLVRGESFTSEQLQQLKVENDRAVVTINGLEIAIEQATQTGTAGNDTINGSLGDDSLWGNDGSDELYGGDGDDYMVGGNGGTPSDNLNDGSDTMSGGNGNDSLWGESGDDYLAGDSGNDYLDGGDGTDTADYSSDPAGVTVDLSAGKVTDGSGSTDTLSNIENVVGSNFADTLKGDANSNRLEGGGGDDLLEGYSGDDTISGGAGNDNLDGQSGSDRVIEQGDVDFTLEVDSIVGTDFPSNDPTLLPNRYLLSGLGIDTLINIETVELSGGASNNVLDTSLATINVNLEGLGGNDTLKGGSGEDTLVGGIGTNYLWGGEGKDIFVTEYGVTQIVSDSLYGESSQIQVIQDFERGLDMIDMAGVEVNQIAFDFQSDPGSTIIRVNGKERVKVVGSMVDSSSLINTSKDLNPDPLSPEQLQNLSGMLQQWAVDYAESLGQSANNVRLVNDQLQMIGGDLTFIDYGEETTETEQGLQIENMTRNASMLFRNNSTTNNSITFTYSDGKGYEVSNQDTTEWTTGNSIGANLSVTVGAEVNLPFGLGGGSVNTTVGASYQQNWSQGGNNTTINTDNVNTQQDTSITFNAPGGAVTKATAIATGGEYSGGTYEIPITISGEIGIDLNGDGDASDANEIDNLPVNAILQYYNPQQFVGEGFQKTVELPTGQFLAYNETTQAQVTGTADGAFFTNVNASSVSAYDVSLTNPSPSDYENGVNIVRLDDNGTPVSAVEERYWLIRDSEYSPRPSGAVLRIENFDISDDFIGIDHNAIDSNDDILLATDIQVGIDPADTLILKAGSYTQNDITFQTTEIIMGGTGDDFNTIDDNDILAELINIAPNQLLGSSRESLTRGDMTSNFMFGTQGTIWDNSLASDDGSNLLQLIENV